MKKVKLKPNQTLKVSGKGTHPLNSKQVNVIVEPIDEEYGEYTIPSYSFLKSNSKQVTVGLRNMSCQPVTLHKGMVVARLSPANVIPEKLAPKLEPIKLASCQLKLAKDQGLKSRVNVIVEPIVEEYGEYTIPSYSFLKSNSKQVTVGLRNMSCQPVTLHKGMVVARLSPANIIPEKLAPKLEPIKLASCQLELAKDQGLKSSQPELESELIQISKMNQATRDQI